MWNGSNVYKQVSYKNWATQNIHLAIATAFTGPFINLKNGNNRFFFFLKSLAYSLKSK